MTCIIYELALLEEKETEIRCFVTAQARSTILHMTWPQWRKHELGGKHIVADSDAEEDFNGLIDGQTDSDRDSSDHSRVSCFASAPLGFVCKRPCSKERLTGR